MSMSTLAPMERLKRVVATSAAARIFLAEPGNRPRTGSREMASPMRALEPIHMASMSPCCMKTIGRTEPSTRIVWAGSCW